MDKCVGSERRTKKCLMLVNFDFFRQEHDPTLSTKSQKLNLEKLQVALVVWAPVGKCKVHYFATSN